MVPEGWEIIPLGVAAKVVDCKHRTPVYADEGYPIVSPGNIRWGEINLDLCRRIEAHELDSMMDHCTVRSGDIVMGRNQSVGIAAYVGSENKFALGQDTILIQPTQINSRYLYDFTASEGFQKQINRLLGGSTFARINLSDIRKLTILAPPLPEQRKIAEILSTWDRAIETAQALLATARTQKRALMQSLLTGKRRFPEFEGQEWKEVPLSKVAVPISARNDGGDLPVLTISSRDGFVRQDEKFARYMAGESVKRYYVLSQGQFAYNKGNSKTYPFGCVLRMDNFEEGLVPHVYVCFELKDGYDSDYYRALFLADFLRPQLSRLVNTGVRNNGLLNISPSAFWTVKVPVPSREEQHAIGCVINEAISEEEVLVKSLEHLRTEKKALMQQLLTGKRRVVVDA